MEIAVVLVSVYATVNPTPLTFSNAANVITSVPFILIGMAGLGRLGSSHVKNRPATILVFLISLILVGAGSISYHWSPSPEHLLWDRLPIAICLAAFACTLANLRHQPVASRLLMPALMLSVSAVLYWYATWKQGHEDLRPYAAVQICVIVYAIYIAFGGRLKRHAVISLRLALGAYIAGRMCEAFQEQIYHNTGTDLGHPLKHLLVALATYFMVRSVEFSTADEFDEVRSLQLEAKRSDISNCA